MENVREKLSIIGERLFWLLLVLAAMSVLGRAWWSFTGCFDGLWSHRSELCDVKKDANVKIGVASGDLSQELVR